MDLRSHYPYWLLRHGIINSYPSLENDLQTEVTIIGAGISGALVAWHLCQVGFKVIIVDRRHVGMGSTAANTALLQYELDATLCDLVKTIGNRNATRTYLLCRDAIYKFEKICRELDDPTLFNARPSFQFASYKKHVRRLKDEYTLRKGIGFDIDLLSHGEVVQKFKMEKPAGLLSKDGAEVDAYKITHLLLEKCISMGARVYDHTEIIKINHHREGVELLSSGNKKINSRWLVIACGYESQRYISKRVQHLHSTYAIVSESFAKNTFWYKKALIWETASPYLYMRTTNDNRILAGGKDIPYSDTELRDKLIPAKSKALKRSVNKLIPGLNLKIDFAWAGSFAYTKDSLPYIGSIPERPHTFFALGLGGNGITCSVIAGEIIRDLLINKTNKDAEIFSFAR